MLALLASTSVAWVLAAPLGSGGDGFEMLKRRLAAVSRGYVEPPTPHNKEGGDGVGGATAKRGPPARAPPVVPWEASTSASDDTEARNMGPPVPPPPSRQKHGERGRRKAATWNVRDNVVGGSRDDDAALAATAEAYLYGPAGTAVAPDGTASAALSPPTRTRGGREGDSGPDRPLDLITAMARLRNVTAALPALIAARTTRNGVARKGTRAPGDVAMTAAEEEVGAMGDVARLLHHARLACLRDDVGNAEASLRAAALLSPDARQHHVFFAC